MAKHALHFRSAEVELLRVLRLRSERRSKPECEERAYKNKEQFGINQPTNDFGFDIKNSTLNI